MRVTVYSTKPYDKEFLLKENKAEKHELVFHEFKLSPDTAVLAEGSQAVCAFVNDELTRETMEALKSVGTQVIALRCAGFNNVDLAAADALGFKLVRVPAYSPHAVAEHTIGLLLTLNRRLYRSYNRVREGNFSLEGLVGFDIHGLTAGVVGTGRIGLEVVKLFRGFGCEVLCYDVNVDPAVEAAGGRYVPLNELLAQSDIISLHCPLLKSTYHMIDAEAIGRMKRGVTLLNTSRGGLVDTASTSTRMSKISSSRTSRAA